MKTLLLALAVVAFVCPDSVNPVRCFRCNSVNMWKCFLPTECPAGENICYTLKKPFSLFEANWVKGCASECPVAGPKETVKCCKQDICNY